MLKVAAGVLAAGLFLAPLHAAEPSPTLTGLTYSGDQSAAAALDREIAEAGRDPAKLAAVESKLLALLRQPTATFAARQAICQRLGSVLAIAPAKSNADAYKSLTAMLADDRESDLARLALEPAPGAAIDALFVSALGKAKGRVRSGLIDSVGRRKIDGAVPALTKLLHDTEGGTAAAAARALGDIATPGAVAALFATPEPTRPEIAAAKLAAASRVPTVAALPMLRELEAKATRSVHRAAALRLGLELGSAADATTRLLNVLAGSDWTLKQAALQAIAPAGADLVPAITPKLVTWDAPTQAAAITALGRRGDAAAAPAILAATQHADAGVRLAAIHALGRLPGSSASAEFLVTTIATGKSDEAKAARQSLAQLRGPDIDALVKTGATRGATPLRAAYIESIALRNQTDSIPVLIAMRHEPDASLRAAAVGALGEIAAPADEDAVLQWTLAATDESEQSRALRALVNTTSRHPKASDRGRAVFAAIENAPAPVATRLLPALSRIGGDPAVAVASRLALRDERAIAEAATEVLNRWPDRTAVGALVNVAEHAAVPEVRKAALEGAVKALEQNRETWTGKTTTYVTALFAAAKEPGTRKRLAALLNRANDRAALEFAQKLQQDPQLGEAARNASEIITANLAGAPVVRASAPANVKNMTDGKATTYWSTSASGDEWVEIGFAQNRPVNRVTLDQTGRAAYFPERYAVFVTDDPAAPGEPRATGQGQRNRTIIELPAGTRGRYVIVKNIEERKDSGWSITEVYVD